MTIIYEFPIDEFHTSDGYQTLRVTEGCLILDEPPDPSLLDLIKKYDGVETQKESSVTVAAAKMIRDYKIDIKKVEGSGADGRVLLKDVHALVNRSSL
jgi:hypothetical protein